MFAHKLVRYGIGGHTIEELNRTMAVGEFLDWMAYFSLEPFGDDRHDWHYARLLAQHANMNRKKGKAVISTEKFLLKFRRGQGQTPDQMKSVLYAQYAAWGGKSLNS